MKKIIDQIKLISLMLSIPIISIIYSILNTPQRQVHNLVSDLDKGIPFIKTFIIPYLGFYPFIFFTLLYLFFKDKETYYKAIITINLGLLASFLIYFVFQTTVPRPVFMGNDLLSILVHFVYKSDSPYNAFPSIHVLLSYLMFKFIRKCPIKSKASVFIIYITSLLIIISTQFVKQHVILDVIAAFIIGEVLVMFIYDLDYLRINYIREKLFYSIINNEGRKEEKTTFLAQ